MTARFGVVLEPEWSLWRAGGLRRILRGSTSFGAPGYGVRRAPPRTGESPGQHVTGDAGVAEGQSLAVHARRTILEGVDDVAGGVLELGQVTAMLEVAVRDLEPVGEGSIEPADGVLSTRRRGRSRSIRRA
jgi:hypothetical protein